MVATEINMKNEWENGDGRISDENSESAESLASEKLRASSIEDNLSNEDILEQSTPIIRKVNVTLARDMSEHKEKLTDIFIAGTDYQTEVNEDDEVNNDDAVNNDVEVNKEAGEVSSQLISNAKNPETSEENRSEDNEGSSDFRESEKTEESIFQTLERKKESERAYQKQAYQRQRDKHRARQKMKLKKRLITVTTIISFVVILTLLIKFLPFFHVKEYVVENNINVSRSEIIEASGIKLGDHIFKDVGGGFIPFITFRKAKVEKLLEEKYSYIQSAVVRSSLPGKAVLNITERVPVSYIEDRRGIVLLDKEGIVLEVKKADEVVGIPVIRNIQAINTDVGLAVGEDVMLSLQTPMLVLNYIVKNDSEIDDSFKLFSQVKFIDSVKSDESYLYFDTEYIDSATKVKLGGQQTLDSSIYWLRYALQTGKLKDLGKGTLDLSGSRKYFFPSTDVAGTKEASESSSDEETTEDSAAE